MSNQTNDNRTILVAKIIDAYTIVINKGIDDGIKEGQRYLIYSIGEEIYDPLTKASLGKLEVIKGTGKVSHAQEKIAILSSDMKAPPLRAIKRISPNSSSFFNLFNEMREVEEILPSDKIPFDNPNVGDLVRSI